MSNSQGYLSVESLVDLFEELAGVLLERGERAQLYVVGGAAIALAHQASRFTRDVDAVFVPTVAVREAAELVAQRHGLEGDWLNDAAKGFIPARSGVPETVFESSSLIVQVASPEELLAMKLFAARDDRDLDDAAVLFNAAGFTDADEAIDLLGRSYPNDLLKPKHRYMVPEVVERAARLRSEEVTRAALLERIRGRAAETPRVPSRGKRRGGMSR